MSMMHSQTHIKYTILHSVILSEKTGLAEKVTNVMFITNMK